MIYKCTSTFKLLNDISLRLNFYFSLGDRINETFNELVKWVDMSDSKVGLLQNVLLTINPEIVGDVEPSLKNNLNIHA